MLLADFANEIITRRIVARYRIPRITVFRLSLSTPSTPFVQVLHICLFDVIKFKICVISRLNEFKVPYLPTLKKMTVGFAFLQHSRKRISLKL